MENKQKKFECAHCGFKADDKFAGDICPDCRLTFWNVETVDFSTLRLHRQTLVLHANKSVNLETSRVIHLTVEDRANSTGAYSRPR